MTGTLQKEVTHRPYSHHNCVIYEPAYGYINKQLLGVPFPLQIPSSILLISRITFHAYLNKKTNSSSNNNNNKKTLLASIVICCGKPGTFTNGCIDSCWGLGVGGGGCHFHFDELWLLILALLNSQVLLSFHFLSVRPFFCTISLCFTLSKLLPLYQSFLKDVGT